ncbi:hypothetical protein OIU84_006707 [Salix udensis]|uniref:Uncharacterized protein n=1 Tax=Salix udensis TaxID=889485 RepID=A0AAD6P2P3_9ROSI|nr:hypothetical protein OIU84_006707 [Salix udensis]
MGSNLIKKDRILSGNGVSLGLVHGNEGFDDDKWGFEGADSKSDVKIGIYKAGQVRTENGLVSNVYGSNSSWNPLSLDLNGWTSHVNGDNSSRDWLNKGTVDGNRALGNNDGWEFKETGSKMQAGDEKEKGEQIKTEIKPTLSFDGSNSTWNGLDGLRNSNVKDMNSDIKQMNPISLDENEGFSGDDEWDFKAAESEYGTGDGITKGDGRRVKNSEGSYLHIWI